jgi:AI-2 transport protein TqsA
MSNASPFARSAIFFSAIVISLAGVKVAAPIVVPFLLALFVAIICNPAIDFLSARRIPRGVAIACVIFFIFAMFFGFGGVIGASVNGFRAAIPVYEAQFAVELQWFIVKMSEYNIVISMTAVREYFDPAKIMTLVTSTLSSFSSVLGNVFLLLLTVVFMLSEGSGFAKKLHIAFDDSVKTEKRLDHFLKSVNKYMAIKTIMSLMTGLMIGFALWLMGVDFYVLWA